MATLNRSFTLPTKIAETPKAPVVPPEIGATEGIETLYVHPNASIIKFTAAARPGSKPGSLSWTNLTERTMAAGQLEIYRVPGSVSFLHSGSVLHTIMKRSQSWCVDGVSKFVLRVLMDAYYRIELPGETEEDLEMVEKFKVTLQKVCHYERTACPFERTFNTDLPEELEVRKGKRRKSTGPAKKWKLEGVWRPEGWTEPERVSEESASASGSPAGSDEESDSGSATAGADEPAKEVIPITPTTPMRQRALAALRSASAPQSPAPLLSTPPSRLRTRVDADGTVEVSEPVATASRGRETPTTRTFQAIPTDMPPSPPDSSAGPEFTDERERSQSDEVHDQPQPLPSYDEEVETRDDSVVVDDRIQDYEEMGGDPFVLSRSATDDPRLPAAHDPTRQFPTHNEKSPESEPETMPARHSVDGAVEEPDQTPELRPAEHAATLESLGSSSRTVKSIETLSVSQEDDTEAVKSVDLPEEQHDDQATALTSSSLEADESSRPQTPQALKEDTVISAPQDQNEDDRPKTPDDQTTADDPYAAIQARILARRSIGGTTHFYPEHKSPTRKSTSSTSSTATISSSKSALSRRSQSSHQQQALATAMVKKACSTFLGPPAHLIAIMLRIAARFANGAFGVESMFYVESPIDSPRKVPGSYYLSGDDVLEDLESDWEEDDFGVPLRSPVRLASRSESVDGLRERRRRDLDVH